MAAASANDDVAFSVAASFADVWVRHIYPVLQPAYEELLSTTPLRMKAKQGKALEKKEKKEKKEKDKKDKQEMNDEEEEFWKHSLAETEKEATQRKIASVLEEVKVQSERRNAYMNLAWTEPNDNTSLQVNIPYEKVANCAMDMFCDTSKAASATDAEATTLASVEGDGTENLGLPKQSLLQCMGSKGGRPWNIPTLVERGYEIPICIIDTSAIPVLGKFKRLGMDVVVNAVWLALYWAIEEKNDKAVSALKHLIIDWPFDFVLIRGSTPEEQEENIFKWTVNMSAKVERLRDFIGLENVNLMRIVMVAADVVKAKLGGGRKADAEIVHTWLVANVRWGTFHCPEVSTVERHMVNWGAIQKNGRAVELIESAVQRWGRNNLLDYPTKLAVIVAKTDATSLCYVVEALYTHMWRKDVSDPYGVTELRRIVPEILWVRSYVWACIRQYPELWTRQGASLVKRFLESPLGFFVKTESPQRDPTWLQSLPTDSLRYFMKHVLDISQGFYLPEIRTALSAISADKCNVEKFNKLPRVYHRFSNMFQIAYDSLLVLPSVASACVAVGEGVHIEELAASIAAESAGSQREGSQAEKKSQDSKEMDLAAFRMQCEKHCLGELEARLVSIVAEGSHDANIASVMNTRLYQNLTASVSFMAYYDVKNARLCNIFEGEGYMMSTVFPTSCSKHDLALHRSFERPVLNDVSCELVSNDRF